MVNRKPTWSFNMIESVGSLYSFIHSNVFLFLDWFDTQNYNEQEPRCNTSDTPKVDSYEGSISGKCTSNYCHRQSEGLKTVK